MRLRPAPMHPRRPPGWNSRRGRASPQSIHRGRRSQRDPENRRKTSRWNSLRRREAPSRGGPLRIGGPPSQDVHDDPTQSPSRKRDRRDRSLETTSYGVLRSMRLDVRLRTTRVLQLRRRSHVHRKVQRRFLRRRVFVQSERLLRSHHVRRGVRLPSWTDLRPEGLELGFPWLPSTALRRAGRRELRGKLRLRPRQRLRDQAMQHRRRLRLRRLLAGAHRRRATVRASRRLLRSKVLVDTKARRPKPAWRSVQKPTTGMALDVRGCARSAGAFVPVRAFTLLSVLKPAPPPGCESRRARRHHGEPEVLSRGETRM